MNNISKLINPNKINKNKKIYIYSINMLRRTHLIYCNNIFILMPISILLNIFKTKNIINIFVFTFVLLFIISKILKYSNSKYTYYINSYKDFFVNEHIIIFKETGIWYNNYLYLNYKDIELIETKIGFSIADYHNIHYFFSFDDFTKEEYEQLKIWINTKTDP